MNILKYEKIKAEFKPWTETYLLIAESLISLIRTEQLDVIHIGSTSAKVGGKGIIDLSVLYPVGKLSIAVEHLKLLGFQDQVSAKPFPVERPRKDGAVVYKGHKYFVHVHVIEDGSEEHHKQLKYKQYMLANPLARYEYEQSKQAIIATGISEQEAYGKLKSPFVKSVLQHL
ncbi:GrpB family protein [Agarivorans sp. QJM3NY_29]